MRGLLLFLSSVVCGSGLLAPASLWAESQRALPSAPSPAATPVDTACFDQHELGQELRQSGQLLSSQQAFQKCARGQCPTPVQRDCERWSTEVADQLPSVVLRITLDGRPRADARVVIDGKDQPAAAAQPVALDPGMHTLRIAHTDAKPFESQLVLRTGERARLVEVALEPRAESGPSLPLLSWVLGGVGIAGTGAFIGFGLSSRSLERDLERRCAPVCSETEIDRVRQRSLLANVSLGVGLSSLAAAGALYWLSEPGEASEPDGASLQLGVAPVEGGALWNVQLRAF